MLFKLFGLLFLAEADHSDINLRVRSFEKRIEIYIRNAINLSASLQNKGVSFTLLTNRKQKIEEILAGLNETLEVAEIPFRTFVPDEIQFFSAHHKLDVIAHLAALQDPYVGMLDLDMLALNQVPACLENIVRDGVPLCYDISDQIFPEYGHKTIIENMLKVSPSISEGRWMGGEFLCGPPAFFSTLAGELDEVYGNYLKVFAEVFHPGMEVPLSVALENLRQKGRYIADAGTLGIVGRYWSVETLSPQRPFSFFKNCFLLHIPADKAFLARLQPAQVANKREFLKQYVPFQATRRFLSRAKRLLKRIGGS